MPDLLADARASAYLPAPWAVPDLEPCSPLCSRILPSGIVALHRKQCERFSDYVLGNLLRQWPAHRPWA